MDTANMSLSERKEELKKTNKQILICDILNSIGIFGILGTVGHSIKSDIVKNSQQQYDSVTNSVKKHNDLLEKKSHLFTKPGMKTEYDKQIKDLKEEQKKENFKNGLKFASKLLLKSSLAIALGVKYELTCMKIRSDLTTSRLKQEILIDLEEKNGKK